MARSGCGARCIGLEPNYCSRTKLRFWGWNGGYFRLKTSREAEFARKRPHKRSLQGGAEQCEKRSGAALLLGVVVSADKLEDGEGLRHGTRLVAV